VPKCPLAPEKGGGRGRINQQGRSVPDLRWERKGGECGGGTRDLRGGRTGPGFVPGARTRALIHDREKGGKVVGGYLHLNEGLAELKPAWQRMEREVQYGKLERKKRIEGEK